MLIPAQFPALVPSQQSNDVVLDAGAGQGRGGEMAEIMYAQSIDALNLRHPYSLTAGVLNSEIGARCPMPPLPYRATVSTWHYIKAPSSTISKGARRRHSRSISHRRIPLPSHNDYTTMPR